MILMNYSLVIIISIYNILHSLTSPYGSVHSQTRINIDHILIIQRKFYK
jgi:hypothetical protein